MSTALCACSTTQNFGSASLLSCKLACSWCMIVEILAVYCSAQHCCAASLFCTWDRGWVVVLTHFKAIPARDCNTNAFYAVPGPSRLPEVGDIGRPEIHGNANHRHVHPRECPNSTRSDSRHCNRHQVWGSSSRTLQVSTVCLKCSQLMLIVSSSLDENKGWPSTYCPALKYRSATGKVLGGLE